MITSAPIYYSREITYEKWSNLNSKSSSNFTDVIEHVEFCLKSISFIFESKIYKEVSGEAMGGLLFMFEMLDL